MDGGLELGGYVRVNLDPERDSWMMYGEPPVSQREPWGELTCPGCGHSFYAYARRIADRLRTNCEGCEGQFDVTVHPDGSRTSQMVEWLSQPDVEPTGRGSAGLASFGGSGVTAPGPQQETA